MLLLNLFNFVWRHGRRMRNEAFFHHLLASDHRFEEGVFINRLETGPCAMSPGDAVVFRGKEASKKPFSVIQPIAGGKDRLPALVSSYASFLRDEVIRGRPYALFGCSPLKFSCDLTKELADGAAVRVFDVADDYTAWRFPAGVAENSLSLVASSDKVFYVNEASAANAPHPRSRVVHNGCDFDNYVREAPPFALAPFWPKPAGAIYAGFIGGVYSPRLDVELAQRLFARFPEVTFLFVGTVDRPELKRALTDAPNSHFVDELPAELLGPVVRSFDVGIVPHLINPLTAGNDLLKLLDYLAAGIPVVSTACSDVARRYGSLVSVAHDPEDFCARLEHAIAHRASHDPKPGIARARAHAWPIQLREVGDFIFDGVG